MRIQQKINRNSHLTKNNNEKDAYRGFLYSRIHLDKTEEDPVNTKKTNESSFEDDEEKISEKPKIQKKSKKLKIKDFLNNNWVISIVVGIIILIISGYIEIYREQGIQGQKIYTTEMDIEKVNKNIQENDDRYISLKENFDIFKAETLKDLEFIKIKLKP